jgi:hypothetical protein
MGKVVMYSMVSVDGFVADEDDQPGPLFDWLTSGDVPRGDRRHACAPRALSGAPMTDAATPGPARAPVGRAGRPDRQRASSTAMLPARSPSSPG